MDLPWSKPGQSARTLLVPLRQRGFPAKCLPAKCLIKTVVIKIACLNCTGPLLLCHLMHPVCACFLRVPAMLISLCCCNKTVSCASWWVFLLLKRNSAARNKTGALLVYLSVSAVLFALLRFNTAICCCLVCFLPRMAVLDVPKCLWVGLTALTRHFVSFIPLLPASSSSCRNSVERLQGFVLLWFFRGPKWQVFEFAFRMRTSKCSMFHFFLVGAPCPCYILYKKKVF